MPALALLVPASPERRQAPPEDSPLGRAALLLDGEGLCVVLGDAIAAGRMQGLRARPGRWEAVEAALIGVHDRFPSQGQAAAWRAAQAGAAGLPWANPPHLMELCRDKLQAQRVLDAGGALCPPVEANPAAFADRLADWGLGFLKPRYGALGVGVRQVRPGDPLPAVVDGLLGPEPALLQRAVPPPRGLAGCAARLLCQRLPGGGWWIGPAALRRSVDDPVVNVARGATVAPARPEEEAALRAAAEPALARLAAQPGGDLLVEVGLDLCLDPDGAAFVIEVNGKPRGRLLHLAQADPSLWPAHVEAAARPLRALAARCGG